MADSEKPDEGKQEAQASDTYVAQPATPPRQQPPGGTDGGNAGNDPTPPQPILVRLVGGDDLKPFEQQSLDISRRTYWIAFFGLWFALAAALFVGVQVFEMTKQTQILASQSESAVASATQSARDTSEQLRIAHENVRVLKQQMIANQRPWFGVLDMKHDKPDRVLPPSRFWLVVSNTGKSPALDATHQFDTGIFETFPENPPYHKSPTRYDKAVILPGVTNLTAAIAKTRLNAAEEQDIVNGKKTFYVYAILRYKDPLTKEVHTTKYCAMWLPRELDSFAGPDNPQGSFGLCPFYNDAD